MKTQSESPFFNLTFFRKFKLENSRHLSKEKKFVKVLIVSASFPCAFWRTEKLRFMLRQFLKYAQQPLPDWGRWAENTTLRLKKIVENVS